MVNLAGDFIGAALALGVGLLGDPLAALVGVGERVPWLLVEEVVGPCRARFGLEIHLAALVREPLAQPQPSFFFLHSLGSVPCGVVID